MNQYKVTLPMPYAEVFFIEAESENEAIEKAESGEFAASYTLPETDLKVEQVIEFD